MKRRYIHLSQSDAKYPRVAQRKGEGDRNIPDCRWRFKSLSAVTRPALGETVEVWCSFLSLSPNAYICAGAGQESVRRVLRCCQRPISTGMRSRGQGANVKTHLKY